MSFHMMHMFDYFMTDPTMMIINGMERVKTMKEEEKMTVEKSSPEKTLTYSNRIEGVGTIEVYGTVNMEKLIKRLIRAEVTGE